MPECRWEFEPERILLKCRQCGEMLVLLGRVEDWHSEGRIIFECECGEALIISVDRIAEKAFSAKRLLRNLRVPIGR
jgi:lysyl-tRNA synthetase class I